MNESRIFAVGLSLLALFSATGCTTPKPPAVRIISDTPMEAPQESPSATSTNDSASTSANLPAAGRAGAESLSAESLSAEPSAFSEPLEGPDSAVNEETALDRALRWAREGVLQYRNNEHEAARKNLMAARIAMFEAELPEVMQERGLAILSTSLNAELGEVDLEAILDELGDDPASAAEHLAEHEYIEREARRILRRFDALPKDPESFQILLTEVDRYIGYYRGRQRAFFERSYVRKHKYWPVISTIFESRGIPRELGYMAFVESGFNPRARSHANARGLWQFIPGTGKRYGLRRTEDFYDVTKATEAATEYLLDLIGIFGSRSFLLATAAYNAGEGRIQGCLRKLDDPFKSRSFWAIRDCLARETREYVPRILAAAILGSDPKRFGFDLPSAEDIDQSFDVVTIPEPTRLQTLANRAGTTVAELRAANSDLSSRATTTPARNFPMYIPKGGGMKVIDSLSAAPGASTSSSEMTLAEQVGSERPLASRQPVQIQRTTSDDLRPAGSVASEYRVQRGDTVAGIAQRFGVSVSDLKTWNPFLNSRVLYRGDRLTVFGQPSAETNSTYRVRSGDTLSQIAERHNVSLRALARQNNLRSPYRLRVGQALQISGGQATSQKLTYRVQRGNTLQTIGQIFSVRYRDIMRWNGLQRSTLQVGQRLTIEPSQRFTTERYKVRRGDSPGRIARRFGVSVSDVLTANGLGRRSVIRTGQTLTIYVPGS